MARGISGIILISAAAVLSGCIYAAGSGGGVYVDTQFSSPPGMVERGADDVNRLDLKVGRPAFAGIPQETSERWILSEEVVGRELPKIAMKAGDHVLGLDKDGEVRPVATAAQMNFARKPAIEAIEELVKSCGGVEFVDVHPADREKLDRLVLTAKAGAVEEEMLFPYLRAVLQMNGFDLVPVDIPFHGRGFMVVRLERLVGPDL